MIEKDRQTEEREAYLKFTVEKKFFAIHTYRRTLTSTNVPLFQTHFIIFALALSLQKG